MLSRLHRAALLTPGKLMPPQKMSDVRLCIAMVGSFAGHLAVEGSQTYEEGLHGAERVPVVHGELVL